MHKHAEEMKHFHLEIESETWKALSQLNPGYGERSAIIRQLLREYLADKTTPQESTHNEQ